MIHAQEIWGIIQTRLPRRRWVPLKEIYNMVEEYGNLDTEDFEGQSPTSDEPKWKRNVRNILQRKKCKNEIRWDRSAKYSLN
jgi:hypothetical protein